MPVASLLFTREGGQEHPAAERASVEPVVGGEPELTAVHFAPVRCGSIGMDPRIGRVQEPGVNNGGAHRLAFPRPVSVVQGDRNGDGCQEGIAGVPHVGPAPERRVAGAARSVLPLRSRHGRGVLVGAGQIGSGTLLVAPSIAIDESWVSFAQGLVVETKPAAAPGLQFKVITSASCSSLSSTSLPVRVLEVQRDAALPTVHTQTHVRTVPIFVVQRVDLDDIGPEVGEGTSGERPSHPEPEVEHPDAGQGVRERLPRTRERVRGPLGGNGPRRAPPRCVDPSVAPARRRLPGVAENSSNGPAW